MEGKVIFCSLEKGVVRKSNRGAVRMRELENERIRE